MPRYRRRQFAHAREKARRLQASDVDVGFIVLASSLSGEIHTSFQAYSQAMQVLALIYCRCIEDVMRPALPH